MNSSRIVPCPRCRKPAEFSSRNPYRPFCSERCRNDDIIAWANEDYQIEGQSVEEGDEGEEEED